VSLRRWSFGVSLRLLLVGVDGVTPPNALFFFSPLVSFQWLAAYFFLIPSFPPRAFSSTLRMPPTHLSPPPRQFHGSVGAWRQVFGTVLF